MVRKKERKKRKINGQINWEQTNEASKRKLNLGKTEFERECEGYFERGITSSLKILKFNRYRAS